ncbi:MAG: Calx-beta domain-containing protein [Patescibacteria group bacterium]|jgi:hypothetical protein
MKSFFRYSFFIGLISLLGLSLFIAQARAEVVSVSCSGTSGSPTAVTEADLAGDDVTFTNGGGGGWCVLDNPISAASVIINTGVTITQVGMDADGITITTTGNFELQSGAFINANLKGCQQTGSGGNDGFGPNGSNVCTITTAGFGDGGGVANAGYQGAGHGGTGGLGTTTSFNVGGLTYDSAIAPILFGSSGGSADPNRGGSGGGIIRLSISGNFIANGAISANGGAGIAGGSGTAGGGGSGGSVYITATSMSGSTGTFLANGGNGGDNTYDGGGGGGGRISLSYGSSTFSGLGSEDFSVSGGSVTGTAVAGIRGTVYTENTGINAVTIYHGFTYAADYSESTWTVDSTATNQYCNGADVTPSLAAGTITLKGILDCTNSLVTGFDVSPSSSLAMNGFTFTMGPTDIFTINDAASVLVTNASTISSNVQWTNLASLQIDAGSSVNADAKGCQQLDDSGHDGFGPTSPGNVCTVRTSGYGDGGVAAPAGYQGGGHGGIAGLGSSATYNLGGAAYDSLTAPVLFGSSGGSADTNKAGSGGGIVRLSTSGNFIANGAISANGGAGIAGGSGTAGGGGSGGSVYVTAGSISGSTGTFFANGGNGGGSTGYGGGGGGGRIAFEYGDNSTTYLANLVAASVVAGGVKGGGTAQSGSVGTLSIIQTVYLVSSTVTDNGGYTNDSTPVITLIQSGALPTHVAFSCNAGSNWSSWIAYPDDNILNDDDGPAFDMTSGATGCSATNETKTIFAKIKNVSGESSSVSDITIYDSVVPIISGVSATNIDGTYGADTVMTVTIQFNDNMAVTGAPQLLLDFNGTDRQADYSSVLTTRLSFVYTIVNGDNKTDLDYVGTSSLTLNSGTIKDLAGNSATLTLALPGAAGSLGANKNIDIVTSPEVNWSTVSQSAAENAGTVTVTANLSFSYASDVTIPYVIAGTAASPSDYSISASPLTITAGNTTGNITITIADDVIDELSETVIVTMGSPTNGMKGAADVHTATITDNDAAPTLVINDSTVSEDAGTGSVTVTLAGGSYLGVSVNYATSSGFAISGTDFTAASGALTWAADETGTKTFNITITDDVLDENNETINVTLSDQTNSSINDGTGTMTVTDNDATPTVTFSSDTANGSETITPAAFSVTLSAISGRSVTVTCSSLAGTATADIDYTPISTTVTFDPGETLKTANVIINNDTLDENNEIFSLHLADFNNVIAGTYTAVTYTITDNDSAPTVSWTSASQSILEDDTTITLTAQLSSASGLLISVPFESSGLATGAGIDYSIATSPVTISPGSTTANIAITIIEDSIVEPDETIIVTMGPPTNASQGSTTVHTASILRDDIQKGPGTTSPSIVNTVTFSAPSHDEKLVGGSTETLRWSSTGNTAFVNLSYSFDLGAAYTVIEKNLTNSGSYSWLVPDVSEDNVTLKIEITDLVNVLDTDTVTFSIESDSAVPEEDVSHNEEENEQAPVSEITEQSSALQETFGARWEEDVESRGFTMFPTSFPDSVTVGTLVKLADDGNPETQLDSAVYYIGADQRRHPFPSESVYRSWFSTFDEIHIIDVVSMSQILVGPIVTFAPDSVLVKFPSVPRVYSVDSTGALHWLTSEASAVNLYGNNWSSLVQDVSEAFWSSYEFGVDLVVNHE